MPEPYAWALLFQTLEKGLAHFYNVWKTLACDFPA